MPSHSPPPQVRETVGFTRMIDGTREDYELLARYETRQAAEHPERILALLRGLEHSLDGYQVTRLEHSLQTATRALRDNADDDLVTAALLHDIGDLLAPDNHAAFAAEILRPYLRPDCVWIVEHHGIFQLHYYGRHIGADPDAREKYRGHPNFDACLRFCEDWDQASFDPGYDSLPLEAFAPLVGEILSRKPWSQATP
ncbi:MAG: HD domain-containing protein [Rhodovibrionaceae bacterium]